MLEVLSEEDIAALVQGFSALMKTAENNITGNEQLAVAVNNRQS